MKKVLVFSVLILLFCCTNYSDGIRQGVIYKFSKKGLVFKTWEGEMNMGGFRKENDSHGNTNIVANTFSFSLDAEHHRGENIDSLAAQINAAMLSERTVRLYYKQEVFTNCSCHRGSEDYFIQKVEIL
jgi:hypothetical protein